jgi:hypothetical protein
MASTGHKSVKHDIISQDSSTTLIAVAVAVFVVIFCLFAMRSLVSQSNFNRRVISEKKTALDQLEKNSDNVEDLRAVYTAFVGEQQNILTGNATGTGPIDGNNADLIIDALPGTYDFPALSSSIEKILKDGGYKIDSIGGNDVGSSAQTSTTATPTSPTNSQNTSVPIPYSFAVSASTGSTKSLLQTLERSIRPIDVTAITLQASGDNLRSNISFTTYYAPEKKFELSSKEVK